MPNQNPIPKLLPKLVNLLFTLALAYGCWYGWQLYKSYEGGYVRGLTDGKVLRDQAIARGWRARTFLAEKRDFSARYGPRSEKTWKDSLYRQGWLMAIDKATEDVPQ